MPFVTSGDCYEKSCGYLEHDFMIKDQGLETWAFQVTIQVIQAFDGAVVSTECSGSQEG